MSLAQEDLETLASKTDIKALPYSLENIVVRGFDGTSPPPRLVEPKRPLFYGYGITAYYKSKDTLLFFRVQELEVVHFDKNGKELHTFHIEGSRYTESFKSYFMHLSAEEKRRIYLRKIYLKDKKGNYIKLPERQTWCPHC